MEDIGNNPVNPIFWRFLVLPLRISALTLTVELTLHCMYVVNQMLSIIRLFLMHAIRVLFVI